MDLKEHVERLKERGELVTITRPVDAVYEAAALIKALDGRPVLLEQVKGFDAPVVSNVCATRPLVCAALGVAQADLIEHLARAADNPGEPAVAAADDLYEELPLDLSRLPVLTHYPEDAGPYIASGVAMARDADHGLNASFHRALVRGADELVLRIVERHLHAFMERGLTELAFCVGNPIQVLVAAAMSVELGVSELAIADALAPTELVEVAGHLVPRSELVLVCERTGELAEEGPFLDLTETFDIVRQQPVFRVKAVYARRDAMFHALLPGDFEHKVLMGMPREPTIFREVSKVCRCLDVRLTPGGCSWLHGVVKIDKRRDDDGRRAMEAAFAGHASMKHVYVVDADIDIDDAAQLEWAMATRFQGGRDLWVRTGQRGSSLDPSSDQATKETAKVGFDLTAPVGRAAEFSRAASPVAIDLDDYLP